MERPERRLHVALLIFLPLLSVSCVSNQKATGNAGQIFTGILFFKKMLMTVKKKTTTNIQTKKKNLVEIFDLWILRRKCLQLLLH